MEEQINPPIPSSKPPDNKLFKILIVIIGLLIAVSLFLNAYLLLKKSNRPFPIGFPVPLPTPVIISPTPVPDPTANWKTYTSSTYGFSFKYPNSVTVKEVHPRYINLIGGGIVMPIFISENPDKLSVEDVFAKNNNSTIEKLKPYLDLKEVQVGNKTALRIIQSTDYFQGSIPSTNYLVSTGNNVITVNTAEYYGKSSGDKVTIVPDTDSSILEFYQQILSTFKFLP